MFYVYTKLYQILHIQIQYIILMEVKLCISSVLTRMVYSCDRFAKQVLVPRSFTKHARGEKRHMI